MLEIDMRLSIRVSNTADYDEASAAVKATLIELFDEHVNTCSELQFRLVDVEEL